MKSHGKGYSLVEVIMALFILVVGLVPMLSLMTGSSSELVKARDRTVAMALAVSVTEQIRATGASSRTTSASALTTAAAELPQLREIVKRYRDDCTAAGKSEWGAGVDRQLANFRCSATLPTTTTVKVEVNWKEAGESRQYTLESALGAQ